MTEKGRAAVDKKDELTDLEVGLLESVHILLSNLIDRTGNEKLKERLQKCFDELPAAEPDGLEWPSA